jgi:hypothetical protein
VLNETITNFHGATEEITLAAEAGTLIGLLFALQVLPLLQRLHQTDKLHFTNYIDEDPRVDKR